MTNNHPEQLNIEELTKPGKIEQLNTQEWEKSIDSILAAMYLMGRQAERANRGDMSAIDTEALNQNNLQKTRIFNIEIQSLISKAVSKAQSSIIEIIGKEYEKWAQDHANQQTEIPPFQEIISKIKVVSGEVTKSEV